MDKLKKELSRIETQFHGSSHITKPGANIFIDLGFSPKVAEKLKLESEQRINEKIKKEALNRNIK